MRTFLLLLCLSFLACGDDDRASDSGRDAATDSGSDGGIDASEDTGPADGGPDVEAPDTGFDASEDAGVDAGPVDCSGAIAIPNAEALFAMTPTMFGSASRSADRPSAGDFVATAAFSVMGSDFPIPSDCVDRCMSGPFAQVRGDVPGVTTVGTTVSVAAGAVFRLRFDIPVGGLRRPEAVISFERPTCIECSAEGRRCGVDDACYSAGESYCLECEGDSPMRCACVDGTGMNLSDGTECFFVTGDIAEVGQCESGSCMRTF